MTLHQMTTYLRRSRSVDREVNMKGLPSIAVCGCGSAGTAIAADLSLKGCKVNLFELTEFEKNIAPVREHKGIKLTGTTSSGKTGFAKLNKITTDAQEAIEDVELIMITVPAPAHGVFLKPFLPIL